MKRELMDKEAKWNTIRKCLSFSFMYSVLLNNFSEAEWNEYHTILDFYDYGCAVNIEVNQEQKESFCLDKALLRMCYDEIESKIPEGFLWIPGPLISHRIMLYLSKDMEPDFADKALREECRRIAEEIRRVFVERGKCSVRIGVGSWRSVLELLESCEESLYALQYGKESAVFLIEDHKGHVPSIYEYHILKKKFLSGIKFGGEVSYIYFMQIMKLISGLTLDLQKNIVLELLVLVTSEVYDAEGNFKENYFDFVEYGGEFLSLTEEQLSSWAYAKFQTMFKAIRQKRLERKGYIIRNVIVYLEEHYQEDISLREVAEHVGMTPQYFSAVFKQEMGQNFVEWMSEHRIQKAMEYLDEPGAVIKEVCFKVGYNDPNYFSKIFKKITGMTPKEYISRGEDDV